MSDSTPAPVILTKEELDRLSKDVDLDRLGTVVDRLTSKVVTLEQDLVNAMGILGGLETRLATGPLHQSNGKSVFHALFRTKEGKASREKLLAAALTAGPLILIPILTSRGVDPVLVSGIAAWFSTQGVSSWRARHQRDLPVDAPS